MFPAAPAANPAALMVNIIAMSGPRRFRRRMPLASAKKCARQCAPAHRAPQRHSGHWSLRARANGPLRVGEVRYGEVPMRGRGIRRLVRRHGHRCAELAGHAQRRARIEDGARALPPAPAKTEATRQNADRASDLPESAVDAAARSAARLARNELLGDRFKIAEMASAQEPVAE